MIENSGLLISLALNKIPGIKMGLLEFLMGAKNVNQVHPSDWESLPDGIVNIDVRTPEEYHQTKIPGAKNINIYDSNFADRIQKLDKNKSYLLYCQNGIRSLSAAKRMDRKGFRHLYNLRGGIVAWIRNRGE